MTLRLLGLVLLFAPAAALWVFAALWAYRNRHDTLGKIAAVDVVLIAWLVAAIALISSGR